LRILISHFTCSLIMFKDNINKFNIAIFNRQIMIKKAITFNGCLRSIFNLCQVSFRVDSVTIVTFPLIYRPLVHKRSSNVSFVPIQLILLLSLLLQHLIPYLTHIFVSPLRFFLLVLDPCPLFALFSNQKLHPLPLQFHLLVYLLLLFSFLSFSCIFK
jgi:hypothetical protein